MHKIKIKNLKTLFELRKTTPIAKRICSGRIFFYNDKAGLCDASCILWPVFLNKTLSVHEADIITFACQFEYKAPVDNTTSAKYDDLHYILNIEEITECVSNLEEWKNAILPNPIDCIPSIKSQNANSTNDKQNEKEKYTCYYKSLTKNRFQLIQTRSKALERINQFFKNRNFIQIETPTLVPSGGIEEYLNPFATQYVDHRGQKIQLQLPTSPEFALKKILTEMPAQIFQISRAYRNQGELSKWHEPEFLMLEWYRLNANLKDILHDTQTLVLCLAEFLGSHISIPQHWPRFRVDELFLDLLNLDLNKLQNLNDFYEKTKTLSLSIVKTDSWNDIFCKLFMEKIEPYLKEQQACFVTHYPVQMAALAAIETVETEEGTIKPTNFALRAEAFLHGVEICNAYFELVDANAFEQRVMKTLKLRTDLNRDLIFENAMKFGLPHCAGNALGVDRVIAILLGEKNISNFYAIPFLSQFLTGIVNEE